MLPDFCFTKTGVAKRIILKYPFKLIFITSSKSDSLIRINKPSRVIPALLTNTSMRPKRSFTSLIKFSATSNFETSPTNVITSPGYASNCESVSASISRVPFKTTLAPSLANSNAIPSPIPRRLPVTTTVLSLNFISLSFQFLYFFNGFCHCFKVICVE